MARWRPALEDITERNSDGEPIVCTTCPRKSKQSHSSEHGSVTFVHVCFFSKSKWITVKLIRIAGNWSTGTFSRRLPDSSGDFSKIAKTHFLELFAENRILTFDLRRSLWRDLEGCAPCNQGPPASKAPRRDIPIRTKKTAVSQDMVACQTMFGLRGPFWRSHPPQSYHTSCRTPVPFGRHDSSTAGGRLVCIPHCLAQGHMSCEHFPNPQKSYINITM